MALAVPGQLSCVDLISCVDADAQQPQPAGEVAGDLSEGAGLTMRQGRTNWVTPRLRLASPLLSSLKHSPSERRFQRRPSPRVRPAVRSSPPSTRSKAVSFLLLDASVLRKFIGRQVGVGDYLFLAWFITAIAMIGGAFGTSLEGDEKVSDAAYGRRQRERQRMLRQMSRPEQGGRRGPDTTDG